MNANEYFQNVLNMIMADYSGACVEFLMKAANKRIRSAVREFYSDYKPKYVKKRQFSLYSMAQPRFEGQSFTILTGAEFSNYSHKDSESYIFENSFMQGYHGGNPRWDGDVPHWKTPYPQLTHWGHPAAKTTPPFVLLSESWDVFSEDEWITKRAKLQKKIIRKYNSELKEAGRRLYLEEINKIEQS